MKIGKKFLATPGLPWDQEKPKKWQKSGKNRVFEKKLMNFDKIWKNVRFCLFKFTKLLNFQCLHLVKISKVSYVKLQKLSINILNNYLLEQAVSVLFLVSMICGKDTFIVKLWCIHKSLSWRIIESKCFLFK